MQRQSNVLLWTSSGAQTLSRNMRYFIHRHRPLNYWTFSCQVKAPCSKPGVSISSSIGSELTSCEMLGVLGPGWTHGALGGRVIS
jgi:hypothetical protein